MQGFRRSFHTAFLAMLLALVLPFVVFLFGTVRHRQLQSTANPRWAQFAKVTGPKATNPESEGDTRRVPVLAASVRSDGFAPADPFRRSLSETSLTGSVAGRCSVEIPVQSQSSEASVSDRQSTIVHPGDDNVDSVTNESTSRLESQLTDIRQRLNQLAQQQSEQQVHSFQLQSLFLQRETAFLDVIKRLSETANNQSSADQGSSDESSSTVEKTVLSPVVPSPKVFTEVAALSPTNKNAPSEDAIRINRKIGRDGVELFTMDVRDADIRQFFGKLSEVAGVSILCSPEVNGQISLTLHEDRFETALKAIVRSRGYVFEREGGIVIVCTADEVIRSKYRNRRLKID